MTAACERCGGAARMPFCLNGGFDFKCDHTTPVCCWCQRIDYEKCYFTRLKEHPEPLTQEEENEMLFLAWLLFGYGQVSTGELFRWDVLEFRASRTLRDEQRVALKARIDEAVEAGRKFVEEGAGDPPLGVVAIPLSELRPMEELEELGLTREEATSASLRKRGDDQS